ncbi:hypothetical protein RBSWK_01551 [Rhodopirellula baltica SWK14]|uniref:Uncharacterized protein n=1 Tax=Rhodopirellula baltica SWK14 TaxID=993516 RepID=L7CNC2_RHOBT|nr:hypothetical protein RBSWK_01551 [Rhodopirellula baltica SWK14]
MAAADFSCHQRPPHGILNLRLSDSAVSAIIVTDTVKNGVF